MLKDLRLLFQLLVLVALASCKNQGTKPVLPYYIGDDLKPIWVLPEQDLSPYRHISSFNLINQSEQELNSDKIKRAFVLSFFFGNCHLKCNHSLNGMQYLQNNFTDPDDPFLITISVDADRDSLEILQVFADKYGAQADVWHFLSGNMEDVNDLLTSLLGLHPLNFPNDLEDFGKLYLIDNEGYLRGIYDARDPVDVENAALDSHLFR